MVKGNKFNPDDVTVESFEGEILHFQAETVLNLFTKVHEKHVPGQLKGPLLVKDEVAAKEGMAKAYAVIADDLAMERQIRDVIIKRDDRGFALDQFIAPLPFAKKEFVILDFKLKLSLNALA